ncbi:type IV pilin [Halorubellus sp. JP-L1]|uniref:type IV pilin n=1 Tax=Halorubellus sp. JP-L1 TaxID=2715753 RepID=UPI00140E8162|nr:type IV pilin N-terminal domain-containing protein [Halorubellus sp. JP-L1]NHN42337.1 type IV pilin [Halorubellus sp. JP-L1]
MTDIHGLLTDDDAVSPVIGVVLMVAVTVILSAAVGAFVLDIGSAVTEQQPTAVIEFEFDESASPSTVTLRHNGGDELETSTLRVAIDGAVAWEDGSAVSTSPYGEKSSEWGDDVTSGDELVLEDSTISESSTVQVIWQKGQQSSIIATSDR